MNAKQTTSKRIMYKLNNVTVVSSKKVKIGKESYDCETTNQGVIYYARMTESQKDIKVVFDEYTIKKTDFGFNITLISDATDVVTFNKKTQMVKHMNMLDNILGWRMRFTDAKSDRKDKFAKEYIDFAAALERSDYVIVYNDDAVENFVRRYVAIMRPLICEQAPVVIDRIPHKLVKYLDKLDIIEKVMIETSPANLAYQLENNMFDSNISVDILPLKTLQKLTRANVDEERIKKIEDYVKSGKGTIDEIELMFRWITAIKKLYEKTTGYNADSISVRAIIDLTLYGFTITEIMNKISKDLMYKSDITHVDGSKLVYSLAEVMDYRRINNIQDMSMPENIILEHECCRKLYDVEHIGIGEAYAIKAKAFNKKYANVIDGVAFMCPEHINDYSPYSSRVTLLSRDNLMSFMDDKMMLFVVGKDNGFYDGPIFAFDENGSITMIKDSLNEQQMAAAKVLWSTIKERKEN